MGGLLKRFLPNRMQCRWGFDSWLDLRLIEMLYHYKHISVAQQCCLFEITNVCFLYFFMILLARFSGFNSNPLFPETRGDLTNQYQNYLACAVVHRLICFKTLYIAKKRQKVY